MGGINIKTPRTLVNAKTVSDLTGISGGLLKYHRQQGHLKGYRISGEREWLYRLDQLNHLNQQYQLTNPAELLILEITKQEG